MIQGKKFVGVEGWTTLAVMLGCVAREVSTTVHDGIYVAVVELVRMNDGACVGRASAECGEEKPWNTRPKYARRSMAQTRATGKACRLAFSWIMLLAGYEVTPAEEMTPIIEAEQVQARPAPAQTKTQTVESVSRVSLNKRHQSPTRFYILNRCREVIKLFFLANCVN